MNKRGRPNSGESSTSKRNRSNSTTDSDRAFLNNYFRSQELFTCLEPELYTCIEPEIADHNNNIGPTQQDRQKYNELPPELRGFVPKSNSPFDKMSTQFLFTLFKDKHFATVKHFLHFDIGSQVNKFRHDLVMFMMVVIEISRTGNEHLHCFVQLNTETRTGHVIDMLKLDGCNIKSVAKGENWVIEYLEKSGTPLRYGIPLGETLGERYRYAMQCLVKGADINYLVNRDYDIYARKFMHLESLAKKKTSAPVRRNIECIFIHGAPRIGKSTYARSLGPDAYFKTGLDKFYDYYSGQDCIIYEECEVMEPGLFGHSIALFNLVISESPVYVQVKGSAVPLKATKFIFTSNITPQEMLHGSVPEKQRTAFLKRITKEILATQENAFQYDKWEVKIKPYANL